MDDILDMNPATGEPSTDATQEYQLPVTPEEQPKSRRRRRTERFAANYEAAAAIAAAAAENGGEIPPEMLARIQQGGMEPPATAPGATPAEPVAEASVAVPEPQTDTTRHVFARSTPPATPAPQNGTTQVPRFQTRYTPPVPGNIPSQGVPRPAALNQDAPRRAVFTAGLGEVRRPVNAQGYLPARPQGADGAEKKQPVERYGFQPEMPKQMQPSQLQGHTRRAEKPVLDDGEEFEQEKGKSVLPIIIIVLLVIAALVLGLLLIPNDMGGPLGAVKRGITGLFGGEEEVRPEALGFTGDVTSDTLPYKINFNVTTTTNVTDVRIVNERGEVMNSTLTASIPNTDNMLHVLTMTIENEYQGEIYLQIFDGENWHDTECKQTLSIGPDMKLKISDTSSTTLTAGSTAAVTAHNTLTAGSSTEPTVSPVMEATEPPVETDDVTPAAQSDETPNVIMVDDRKIMLTGSLPVLEQAMPNATVIGFPKPSGKIF